MSIFEILEIIFHIIVYFLIYMMFGFGPGFVAGMLLVNGLFGRGQQTYYDSYEDAKKKSAQHNAQWAPSHERWQK